VGGAQLTEDPIQRTSYTYILHEVKIGGQIESARGNKPIGTGRWEVFEISRLIASISGEAYFATKTSSEILLLGRTLCHPWRNTRKKIEAVRTPDIFVSRTLDMYMPVLE